MARWRGEFPSDKINEAIKRLIDRRYVVRASHVSAGIVAGYWAMLGLPPEVAAQNLENCRVRIQSIDVQGAPELGAALQELGVRVVKNSPDLTVTLVNDYLERQLAELNLQRVADKTRWLLVWPSGVFPLVGPVFSPGESACWTCLFDRMIRNREIKGFLDRGPARAVADVAARPQTLRARARSSSRRLKSPKRSQADFAPICAITSSSFDLMGSTIAKHYVARRPQCPTCGSKKLRNPRRAPAPIELGPGAKLVMTSGGYRTVSSRATVARFRKHVSPLTGVVTRLERIDVDLPMNTNFYAQHNFSAPAQSVDQLRSGLSGGSFGKGSTAEQGEASALMEAIERYSGIFQGDEIRIKKRFTDFPAGDAIAPNDILLFSDAQYRTRRSTGTIRTKPSRRRIRSIRQPASSGRPPGRYATSASNIFRPACCISSIAVRPPSGRFQRLRRRQHARGSDRPGLPRTGGARCLCDLVVQPDPAGRKSTSSQFDDSYVRDLKTQLADTGRKLWVLDITSDLGIPTYVAIVHWMQNGQENIEFGSGAHFDPPHRPAARR